MRLRKTKIVCSKALGKLGNIVAETLFPINVSQSGQTLGNISEKLRETSNVSEFARKHFWFRRAQQCFHGWANRETFEETSRITNVAQQYFLVCPGLIRIKPRLQRGKTHAPTIVPQTTSKFLEIYIGWFL